MLRLNRPSNRVTVPTLELLGNESRMNICIKKSSWKGEGRERRTEENAKRLRTNVRCSKPVTSFVELLKRIRL